MSGVNKVILIGRLGRDPEMKFLASGSCITNIALATSEKWKDKNTNEQQEKTEWHRVSFFGRVGEFVGEYCRKGSMIFCEGKLQTRKWQDQEGNDRYTTEIAAHSVQLLGESGGERQPQQQPRPEFQPQQQPKQQKPAYQTAGNAYSEAKNTQSFQDDIPF